MTRGFTARACGTRRPPYAGHESLPIVPIGRRRRSWSSSTATI